jgi:hypothetical protein
MIFFALLLQFFTVAVGLAVILLLAAFAGIWTGIRDEIRVRKIERGRRRAVEDR